MTNSIFNLFKPFSADIDAEGAIKASKWFNRAFVCSAFISFLAVFFHNVSSLGWIKSLWSGVSVLLEFAGASSFTRYLRSVMPSTPKRGAPRSLKLMPGDSPFKEERHFTKFKEIVQKEDALRPNISMALAKTLNSSKYTGLLKGQYSDEELAMWLYRTFRSMYRKKGNSESTIKHPKNVANYLGKWDTLLSPLLEDSQNILK